MTRDADRGAIETFSFRRPIAAPKLERPGASSAFRDGWDFARGEDGAVLPNILVGVHESRGGVLPRYAWLSEPHEAPFVLPIALAAPACVAIAELWAILMLVFWPAWVGATLVAVLSAEALLRAGFAGRGRAAGSAQMRLPWDEAGMGVRYEAALRQAIAAAGLHASWQRTNAPPRGGFRRTEWRLCVPIHVVYHADAKGGTRAIGVSTTGRTHVGEHQRLKGAIIAAIAAVDRLPLARDPAPETHLTSVSSASARPVQPPKPNGAA